MTNSVRFVGLMLEGAITRADPRSKALPPCTRACVWLLDALMRLPTATGLGEDGCTMTFASLLPKFRHSLDAARGRRPLNLALLLLALASAVAWTLAAKRLTLDLPVEPLAATPAEAAPTLLGPADLARLLGQAQVLADEAVPRFELVGVMASASGLGAALIAVDGAPPRPFAVGTALAPGYVLQRLSTRQVMLADTLDGPIKLTLTLPAWSAANAAERPAPSLPPMTPSAAPQSAPQGAAAGTAPSAGSPQSDAAAEVTDPLPGRRAGQVVP